MVEPIEAFPLHWPTGFERAKSKKASAFKTTLAEARDGVIHEIKKLGGKNVIISSSIPLKRDGQMYGTARPVDGDHGVAVYFTWKNDQYVLACDSYQYIWENLRAIEKSIDAIRGLERWGASDILSRAFTGFKQLPEANNDWWKVLEVEPFANIATIKSAYKLLIKKYHPDNPETGNEYKFLKIQEAYAKAMKYDKA